MQAPHIDGIFNYCDRWCERCGFSARCGLFRSADPSPAEPSAITHQHPGDIAAANADPLAELAREYTLSAWRVLLGLDSMPGHRFDGRARRALETIGNLAALVGGRTHRAILGTPDASASRLEVQTDANGSAKVARLAIDESRDAWRVLMEPGRAVANGVPAQFVRRLDELDIGLARRFPRAMEFMRPGFDD